MNVIAGLLRNLAPSPEPRAQGQANGEAQAGKGNGFGKVLSELSLNSEADGANSAAAQKPAGVRVNADDTQVESAESSSAAGPANMTTVAQTLAAFGDLAALAEQNAATAANGNGKTANPNLANGLQKNASANFASTDESQQPGNATVTSEMRTARQAWAKGVAATFNASTGARNATSGNQPANAGTTNAAGGGASPAKGALVAVLTQDLAAQTDQAGPAGGSNRPSDSKDAGKDANQANAANSANVATTFAADAAAMAASFQSMAPAPPLPGGATGARGDVEKPNTKSANQRPSPFASDPNANASPDPAPASIPALDAVAAIVAASIQPPAPPNQAPMQSPTPMPAGGAGLAGLANASLKPAPEPLSQIGATAADVGAANPVKITVLSTATHFAPPAQYSPIQQIATAVAGAIPDLSPGSTSIFSAPSAASDSAPAGSASSAVGGPTNVALPGPAKVLNLQLEPPNLGTVTISLNLSSGGLDVQVAASQPGTANLIERDKNALSDQLRDSGYSVVGVAVSLDPSSANVANDGSATQGQANQAFSQNNGQDMSQGGTSNGNGSTGENGRDRSLPDPLAPIPESVASVVSGRSASGELYI